ncbi:ATP-dependent Clp protease ATP-binding subunit [Candidatus Odyssella acanthamoebae]|uniref:Clp protease ClpC n=1 Tax=Candidatus Odyssella acanthamoebae TaxID=91604 RepID=A0A077AY78_9PROT|nr:AAA family ATPase [Candidatus Paracaedibacter acanthamoebae]AIK95700.1 Clp protease ClpC [Candidatus Paracaedibacter acanthamoebae]
MSAGICDVCSARATVHTQVVMNGRRRQMDLCDAHYLQLVRQHRQSSSPLGSLFGRDLSLFEEFFGEGFFPSPLKGSQSMWEDEGEAVTLSAGKAATQARRSGYNLLERLSKHAEELLQAAAHKAVELGRREVDTEHLLYALTDSGVVRTILEQFKISVDELKRQIDEQARRETASKETEPLEMGISPRIKDTLSRAFLVSQEMGHSYIGPEHLLIGLAEEGEGIAADLLRRYGLTPQSIRQQVTRIVGRGAEEGRIETPSGTPNLDKYSRDLTKLAREGKLDPVIGRAKEIETTIEVLARRKKNNPILIGEPGVGKTAIVEGLAQRIIAGEVPEGLRNNRLVELSINSLVAGSKYRGEFEERVQQILKEVTERHNELILFIDEIHTIVGAGQGGSEGGLDIANVFKPALAHGELNLIGATTLNEYQKHIEKDAALERRFQPVLVPEPTVAQTIMILRGLRDRFEAHHKVTITDEAIIGAVELADRYISNRFLPDKAIDLIDQAAARVKIATTVRPVDVQELEVEVQQIKREQDYAASRKQFDRAAEFKTQVEDKEAALDEAKEQWRRDRASATTEVRFEHVAEVISKLTGIPVTEITAEERNRLIKMEERLHQRIVGQNEAVEAVSDAVRLARAGLSEGRRPVATFLFLGPTGVGKTELAKALAEIVYGDEDAMIRLDMSEYMERHSVARLIGAPPGYVGYEEGGQLTERVRRRPYCVILLDEIEKAHPDVHNLLLQVFDDGRLTDGKGRVVDFTNTILISTSNLGADIIQRHLRALDADHEDQAKLKHELMEVLRGYFRPEFINRIDEVIVFHALNREEIHAIVELQLERVKRSAHGQGINLSVDLSLVSYFASAGYKPEFGARELRRLIRSKLETALAHAMLASEIKEGDTVVAAWDPVEQKVTFSKLPNESNTEEPTVEAKVEPTDSESPPEAPKP